MQGILTADGPSPWFKVHTVDYGGGVHISGSGTFGGGTVTIQKLVNNKVYSVLDSTDTALTNTAAFDRLVDVQAGDIVRINLASSTSPALDWSIAGNVSQYSHGNS